ncbi:MAG: acyltransferase domain-containing protein, partial [Clostridiales bacterium]|nr:acyltransferase domain-containing protein [Clostridiales bacterium]
AAVCREEAAEKLRIAAESLAGGAGNERGDGDGDGDGGVIESWRKDPEGIFYRSAGLPDGAKIATLFSGQGAQYLDMFSEATACYPELSRFFGLVDDALIEMGLDPVSEVVFAAPTNERARADAEAKLLDTKYTQPALAAVCGGIYKILSARGYREDFLIGHSFGEITGLWAGGAIDERAFVKLAAIRGAVMSAGGAGSEPETGMAAVFADKARCLELIKNADKLYISNENSDAQTTVSGDMGELKRFVADLNEKGVSASILKVSRAFHSPYMAGPNREFNAAIDQIPFSALKKELYSCADGKPYGKTAATAKKTLSRQIEKPVLFKSAVLDAYEKGARVFVEVGPGRALSGLTSRILAGREHEVISMDGGKAASAGGGGGAGDGKTTLRQLEEAFVQLRLLGLTLSADPYAKAIGDIFKDEAPKSSYVVDPIVYMTPAKRALVDAAKWAADEPLDKFIGPPGTLRAPPDFTNTPDDLLRDEEGDVEVRMDANETVIELQSLNGQALERFLASQEYQIGTLKDLLRGAASGARQEDVLRFAGAFQHNSMKAYEAYFQGQRSILGDAAQSAYGQSGRADQLVQPVSMRSALSAAPAFPAAPAAPTPFASPAAFAQPTAPAFPAVPAAPVPFASPAAPAAPVPAAAPEVAAAPAVFAAQGNAFPIEGPFDLTEAIIKIVAEKTGYPEELVDADMNIESDLGIDSIKRIEIFSELNTQFQGSLEKEDAESIAMLHTIAEISEYLKKKTH